MKQSHQEKPIQSGLNINNGIYSKAKPHAIASKAVKAGAVERGSLVRLTVCDVVGICEGGEGNQEERQNQKQKQQLVQNSLRYLRYRQPLHPQNLCGREKAWVSFLRVCDKTFLRCVPLVYDMYKNLCIGAPLAVGFASTSRREGVELYEVMDACTSCAAQRPFEPVEGQRQTAQSVNKYLSRTGRAAVADRQAGEEREVQE
jgi:hypothetical protein